jgi:hypothetical protein
MVRIRSWSATVIKWAFSLVLGTTTVVGGPSATGAQPTIDERLAAVRSSLYAKHVSGGQPGTTQVGAAVDEDDAQWGNWLNWNNWGNWNNWNNWGNWANWWNF